MKSPTLPIPPEALPVGSAAAGSPEDVLLAAVVPAGVVPAGVLAVGVLAAAALPVAGFSVFATLATPPMLC
jgi:hypothetical protein